MTRNLLGAAAALALVVSSPAYQGQVAAQESSDTSAEADAQTDSNATADSSGSADAQQSSDAQQPSSSQADTQTSTSNDTATSSDAQATTSSDPNSSQSTTTDTNTTQGTSPSTSEQQPAQSSGPSLPAPSEGTDANAPQPEDRSLLNQNQQPAQTDATSDRSRTDVDVSGQGRANVDARMDQRTQRDFRRDIRFGRATNRGLTIDTIDNRSIFFRSGFRRGDVIVSLHGQQIRSDADFYRVFQLYPGQRVPVIVLRNGREETIFVEAPREYAQPQRTNVNRPVGGQAVLGVQFDVQARDAAVVRDVTPGSPAEQAGLQRGDVIVALNGAQVMRYPDAISVVRSMRPGDRLEIILDRNQSEIQTEAILAGQPAGPLRTATRDADVYVEREVVPVEPRPRVIIDGRYNDGRSRYYNDRDYDRDGDYEGDDQNYRGRPQRGRLFGR
jgi:hypothetical protein